MANVHEIITNEIINQLNQDVIPWRKEFNSFSGLPRNIISNKPYQGINILMLMCQTFPNPYWMTFKQASQLGGKIKKGEKHTKVVFWTTLDKENDEGKNKKIPFMRYYMVWNLDQTEECQIPKHIEKGKITNSDITPIEACEKIVQNFKDCPVIIKGRSPKYRKSNDTVEIPHEKDFMSMEHYYNVLFHELAHSTLHLTRLNRESLGLSYAEEEMVAEIAAAFLSQQAGIGGLGSEVFKNGIAYIQNWARQTPKEIKIELQKNPRMITKVASLAQKASDHILGINEFNKDIENAA